MKNGNALEELKELADVPAPPKKPKSEFFKFYHVSITGNEENPKRTVKVDFYLLVQLLKQLGFARMDVDKKSFIVRIIDNVVEECSPKDVIDTFEEYIKQFPENLEDGVMRDQLLAKMYGSLGTFFSEHLLNRMKTDEPIKFNEDTRDAAFFYYKNGLVRVDANGAKLLPYSEMKGKIWKGQILERDFTPLRPNQFHNFAWTQFCSNIANNYLDKKTNRHKDPERFLSFQTVVGYLLHAYFEGKLKSPIFTDSRISEEASGRTGKTLLFKAMQKMKNANQYSRTAVDVNGKDFDPMDRFKWQDLALDTSLVCLNDVRQRFNFEALFNDITEGVKCQRKNESPFIVKAKLLLTTNRTIRIHGSSAKDRCLEFEMADYYSADFSPEKEFSHWFFRDWNEADWLKFDNFMLQCVSKYLKHGIIKPEAINLLTRKLYEETSQEFINWITDRNIEHKKRYDKKEWFEMFMRDYKDQFSKLTPRTFTAWLKRYAEYQPEIFEKVEDPRSNGRDFIEFHYTVDFLAGPATLPEIGEEWTPAKAAKQEAEAAEIFGE